MGNLQKKVVARKKLSLKYKIASAKRELMEIRANQKRMNTLLDEFNTYSNFMEKREKYLTDFTKKAFKKVSLEEGDEVTMEVKQIEPVSETENEEFTDYDFDDNGDGFEEGGEDLEKETEAKEVVKKEMARLKVQLANLERKLK